MPDRKQRTANSGHSLIVWEALDDRSLRLSFVRRVHELALMEDIVSAITERVGSARVDRVRLQIGQLAGVVPEALRFCFEACAAGTTLEGATVEIEETNGRGVCRSCGAPVALASFLDLCGCGSADIEVVAGQEMRVKEVEVY
ncbi:MAG TPA: hydrogenase maturation nickel metallochaperone HypA [Polyangia bacterium]|jgi:hydrogenase nickel incorporation protein HypA/HybF